MKNTKPLLSKRATIEQTIFPKKIAGYSFVKELHKEKTPKPYSYGLYKNNAGKKAFAKVWAGRRKNQTYQMLKNEIFAYKFILSEVSANESIREKFPTINTPVFIRAIEEHNRLIILLEYVNGKILGEETLDVKISTLKEVLSFFSHVNQTMTFTNSYKFIPDRQLFYWLLLLPFISIKGMIINPSNILLLFKANLTLIKNLHLKTTKNFIHRDIGEWNIFINKKGIWIYDFQLACFSDQILEYAVTAVKISKTHDLFDRYNKLMHTSFLHDDISKKKYLVFTIIIFLYEMSNGNKKESEIPARDLKRYLYNEQTSRILPLPLRLLLRDPRNYLFSFTLSNKETITIKPHSKKTQQEALTIIREIKKLEPKLVIHFVGSANLGIAGQSDIDLMAEATPKDFEKYIPSLNKILGEPTKRRDTFIEWNFVRNGCDVEFSLIDPNDDRFQERIKAFYILKKNKKLLKEYEKLKKSLQGISVREYTIKRIEFFNRILQTICVSFLMNALII